MKLTEEKHRLEYLLSPRSLKLHTEFEAMTKVMRKLDYIDSENMGKLYGLRDSREILASVLFINTVEDDGYTFFQSC